MKLTKSILIGLSAATLGLTACEDKPKTVEMPWHKEVVLVPAPQFNSDSAYAQTARQVAFGPRVPNTEAHKLCGDYLAGQMRNLGWNVMEQSFEAKAFTGQMLQGRNLIAEYKPEAKRRILLAAHWDSRPFADQDTSRQNEAIDGASDGASGTAVLLEVMRQVTENQPNVGVDVIFFDLEDYGQTEASAKQSQKRDTWCLGSQYWSKNLHKPGYSAYFGILLDMVGAQGATFYKEGTSLEYAPSVVQKVWEIGQKAGFGSYFVDKNVPGITDDHAYVNKNTGIPMIDIIQFDAQSDQFFGHYWHTHKDNMDVIDRNTLKAVGQTVLQVIYNEQPEAEKPVQ